MEFFDIGKVDLRLSAYRGVIAMLRKTITIKGHRVLLRELVAARKAAGLRQEDLATLLGKGQSFVSDVERGQRRIDVIEFLEIMRMIKADPHAIIDAVEREKRV